MKNLIIFINITIIIGMAAIFTDTDGPKSDGHRQGDETLAEVPTKIRNAARYSDSPVSSKDAEASDEFVATFITEIAEARLMDLEEGKIAQQRSTTKDLKSYGTLMINDQTEMLHELKKLAALKHVTIPSALGSDKAEELNELKEVHGKSFDKKFIKMMIIDHKRDVKKFEQATRSSDADIQVFATKYLPYIQSHLERIRGLK